MRLFGFVFGIRVSKSFYLEDKLGAIVDELLYTKNSAFGPSLFPIVQEVNGAKILFNQSTGNKLTITHSDFIFEYNIKNNFNSEFEHYLDAYKNVIIKKIFKNFDVHNISRFGFIVKAELSKNDTITDSVYDIIKQNQNNFIPDSYSLRFNIREKKPLTIKGVITQDFDNTIVTYDKINEENPLMFSVDYQKYFRPELNTINDSIVSFEEFCKKSFDCYKKKYIEKSDKT